MHNELTKKDIQMMREELDYRRIQLRPQLLEAVKEARAFGDLSENFEYKAAKQEKNRNESRIRFLENMIKTAVVLPEPEESDGVALYDKVTVFLEDEGDTEVYQVVTTMRQDALHGLISKESPLGKALLGRRVGEKFHPGQRQVRLRRGGEGHREGGRRRLRAAEPVLSGLPSYPKRRRPKHRAPPSLSGFVPARKSARSVPRSPWFRMRASQSPGEPIHPLPRG